MNAIHRLLSPPASLCAGLLGACLAIPPALAAPTDQAEPLLANTRQLTFEGRRAGEGYFSADGELMVFQSEREPGNPFFQIYLMDLTTGDTHRVSPGMGKTTCAWIHPSGQRVLFASTHEDPEAQAKQRAELEERAQGKARRYSWSFDPTFEIYATDLDGGAMVRLTDARGYDAEGSYSPDGRYIAFASNRHAYGEPLDGEERERFEQDPSSQMDIYLMRADGTDVRRLTDAPGYDGGPFFSPDGQRIVWRRFTPDHTVAEVYTMRLDGSDVRQVTHLGAMSWAPYYHPSGDYIVFATNLHGFGNFELYLVDADGQRDPVRVTNHEGFDGLPVFHPDGKRLFWTSGRTADKTSQIVVADWDDAAARRLLGLDGASQARGGRAGGAPPRPDLAATRAAITAEDIRLHVDYLADEALEGRLTGTPGARLAEDYVAHAFRALGLEPAGADGGFFQPFAFTAGVSLGDDNRLALDGEPLTLEEDWRPLAFSRTGEAGPGGLVFAGYGLVAPASDGHPAYDSYGDLEVAGRWVMVLRYVPEDIPQDWREHLTRFADLQHKAMLARERGALGLVVVSGPNAPVSDPLVRLSFDAALATSSMAVLSLSDALADALLQRTGHDLKTLQDRLDAGETVPGFAIPQAVLAAHLDIRQERRTGRNVIARLPAQDSEGTVVVGAHLDHLGHGLATKSRALPEEKGEVHPGADDNASGVAGLLEIAQHLAERKAKGRLTARRDIVFAAWSGEELGVLGSNHYVKALQEKGEVYPRVAAYLNMDMIGRLKDKLVLQGVGSSSLWPREIERRNVPVGLPIVTQSLSYLPTDATPFYLAGVPVLSAFSGAHSEYHTPRDVPETLNYPGAADTARLLALITESLAERPEPPDYVAQPQSIAKLKRRNLRLYLGTIPDYSQGDIEGVRLSGVARGGPADQAGLRGGDIVVGLGGRSIETIYDYTYALDALKPDQSAPIVVLRGGERVELSIVPGTRE
jgi:Tol biopolymer transport system component